MKHIKSIVFAIIIITFHGKAQHYRYYFEPHLSTGIQRTAPTAGFGGAFGFLLNNKNAIDIRAREVYNFNNRYITGAISATYRYYMKYPVFIGAGFAHHHEIDKETYLCHPIESAMGTHKNIFHRSGFALEIGYDFKPLTQRGFWHRLIPSVGLQAAYMFMDKGPNPFVSLNGGIKYCFGK